MTNSNPISPEDIEEAQPASGSRKRTSMKTGADKASDPKLLHPSLEKLPMNFRFACNGLLCNVLFMVAYNKAVYTFEHMAHPSTIYSVVYLIFIPLGHAAVSLLVFGWPEKYLFSLLSNSPIGLTALAIGAMLTAYLDRIHFEQTVEEFIRNNFTFSSMPPLADDPNHQSEFYSSLLVLVVTSIWSYVLSIYVNSPPKKSEKKEL